MQSPADFDRIRDRELTDHLDHKYGEPVHDEPGSDSQSEEDQQAEIWRAIENGDLGLLAAMMVPK